MASKRKSTIPCMIPVKTMHLKEDVEPNLPLPTTKDSAYLSREDMYSHGYLDLGESSRHESSGDALKDGGTYTCRPCNFETLDLNLFLDHVYSGHPEFRSDPSFHCVDCGVTAAKFEGLALHNARVHPSTVTTTLQLKKRDRKVTVEQSIILGPGDSVLSKSESEISISKTPIMKMLKGKSEHKRIIVSHSVSDESRLDAGVSVTAGKPTEKKDPPSVTVTHVPTIVHNGSTSKVTLPSAIQIVNGSGALPILKTAVTQVVSVVQNRNLHQQSTPITVSSSPSSSSTSSKNMPKVMIPLSSIPTYNASMDNSSFLKTSFSKFPYPTKAELCYLTVVTKYPEEQIKIWFTAQRLKQGISWSPEEIEDARRKMFNTIIQTAPSSGHHTPTQASSARQAHHSAQQTITVLPASLGATGIPHILQGSLVSQGGVIVTQPMMANGIQVSSAPVALAVTPKPQSPAKPTMQARPAAALVADKGISMVVGTVGSSSSLNYTISSSSSSSNGRVSSSSSTNSSSSSSIMSSSSGNSIGSNSGNSSQTSVISTGANTIITTAAAATSSSSSSSNIKTGNNNSSNNNINSNTTKSSNGNKSTENGKSAANGKSTAPSATNTKSNQDAKSGSNGKDGSSSSTVKSTNGGKASPDVKTSTDGKISIDGKGDGKTDSKSNGTSSTASATTTSSSSATTTNASSRTNSPSASAAASATVTTTSNSNSKKGGETATTVVTAASSPSTSTSTTSSSSSRSSASASPLDPNAKQNKKSQEQLSALKQSFLSNQFPNQDEVNRLTSLTGLSVREVRKWFSDRRYHFRNLKGPRTSTGGQASGADKNGSPAPASGAGGGSADAASSASADRPKTPPPTPVSPPQQQQQTTSPTTPSRRPPRPPSPDFTAIRYKEREPHQLVALEASFLVDPDPSSEEVDRLRQETKMTRREIHGWFAERRKRAAAEKKKEDAERAEREEAEACMEEGEKSEPVKEEDKGEKMDVDEPTSGGDAASSSLSSSSSSHQGKDEKQKEDAPKVNPIKINLKMLKVTESNGKEGEGKEPAQADPPKTSPSPAPPTSSPIPASSTPYRGKKTADQLHVLKQAFARTQWPGSPQYDDLMARTGLPRPEVVRWFGDCRYVLKNGQLKWLESYQTMVEEEDFQKANLDVLKEHLEANGKLDESQVKELAKDSGLTEDLVRRWFTNRAPLLLAAKKEEGKKEEEEEEEKKEEEEEEKGNDAEMASDEGKEKEPKVEGASLATAQHDQGSKGEEKTEHTPPPSPASTASTRESEKTKGTDANSSNPNQGAA